MRKETPQIIIASYHKTGTLLFYKIFEEYKKYNDKFNFQFVDHFNEVEDITVLKSKCIVIIRHPYEIIMSAMRWHQVATAKQEPWLYEPYNQLYSYYEYINSLKTIDEKILFEMDNSSGKNINKMYENVKNRTTVLFIKLEDLWNRIDMIDVCKKIKVYLEYDIHMDKLVKAFESSLSFNHGIGNHRTNPKNCHTYIEFLKDIHYQKIKKTFPSDLLEVLGY